MRCPPWARAPVQASAASWVDGGRREIEPEPNFETAAVRSSNAALPPFSQIDTEKFLYLDALNAFRHLQISLVVRYPTIATTTSGASITEHEDGGVAEIFISTLCVGGPFSGRFEHYQVRLYEARPTHIKQNAQSVEFMIETPDPSRSKHFPDLKCRRG